MLDGWAVSSLFMFCSHLMMIMCCEKDAILMDFSSTWIIRMVQSGCLLQKSLQVLVHSQFKLTMRVFLKVVRLLLIVSNISLTWPPAFFFPFQVTLVIWICLWCSLLGRYWGRRWTCDWWWNGRVWSHRKDWEWFAL